MKQRILLFCLSLFLLGEIQAQSCGTPELSESAFKALPYYGNNAFLQHYADSLAGVFNSPANRIEGSPEVWYRVPVQFWIYTWQGQNSFNTDEVGINKRLKTMIWDLNNAMQKNNTHIRFYMFCPRFFEDEKAAIENSNITHLTNISTWNNTPQALNCHIINNIPFASGMWHPITNALFIHQVFISDAISGFGETGGNGNSTFIHEVGHWLGLNHTHAYNSFPCLKEPVSRGVFSSVCTFGAEVRHCDIRGDGLCDTPADPNIGDHDNDVRENCNWITNLKDDRGDYFAPDTRNYMSYGRSECLSYFSTQQRQVMLLGINLQRDRLDNDFTLTTNNDFDTFEPDNNAPSASLIRFNETQIRSFSNIGSCEDDDDWVKFAYPVSQVALEDMVLELENVDGYQNPVSEIEFWDAGSGALSPVAVTRLNYTQIVNNPTKISYIIPCTLPTNRTYLFRVVRNGNQTGRYKLTLKKKVTQVFGDRLLCGNIPKTFTLTDVPAGATFNWIVSRGITIVSGQGTPQLTVVANGSGTGFITPNLMGCGNTLTLPRIDVVMGVTDIFPINYTATPYVGQTITFTIQKPEPLNRDAYSYQLFVIPQSSNQFYNWSLVSYVDTGTHIEMSVKVGLGSAEIAMEVNSCNQIVARPNIYVEGIPDPNCYYGFRVSPNPAKDFISITRNAPEPCIGLRTYQGKLYNKYSKLIWQGEIKEDIQIDARKLPDDVYFLHLTDEKGNTQKQQIIVSK